MSLLALFISKEESASSTTQMTNGSNPLQMRCSAKKKVRSASARLLKNSKGEKEDVSFWKFFRESEKERGDGE